MDSYRAWGVGARPQDSGLGHGSASPALGPQAHLLTWKVGAAVCSPPEVLGGKQGTAVMLRHPPDARRSVRKPRPKATNALLAGDFRPEPAECFPFPPREPAHPEPVPCSCLAPPRNQAPALAALWPTSGWLELVPGLGDLPPCPSLISSAAPSSPGPTVGPPKGSGCGPFFTLYLPHRRPPLPQTSGVSRRGEGRL